MAFKYYVDDKDKELLELIAAGYNSIEIGEILFISNRTVQSKVENMMHEMDAKNRSNLVAIAYEKGHLIIKLSLKDPTFFQAKDSAEEAESKKAFKQAKEDEIEKMVEERIENFRKEESDFVTKVLDKIMEVR